jgi:hypothetical protein
VAKPRLTFSLLLLGLFLSFSFPAHAAELIMFRQAACPWCAAWDRAIGPIYAKTEIGKRAPLRELDIGKQNRSGVTLASRIIYTPTFVVAENGREIGRIEGYPGEDFFWGRLDSLMRKLPAPQ